jgi:hypothetical protein
MTKPLILNKPASFQIQEMIKKLLEVEDASGFNKEKKAILYEQMLNKLVSLDCVEARCALETIKVLLIEIGCLTLDIQISSYQLSDFVSSDCPARETEWTCPDPVQLSPEKIEQEKKQAEKKIFRSVHTKKILGSLEKIEIVYGYTVYVFSDGSRWNLENYYRHLESIPLYGPYLSDYGINRKDKEGFSPVRTYQATNDMFQ